MGQCVIIDRRVWNVSKTVIKFMLLLEIDIVLLLTSKVEAHQPYNWRVVEVPKVLPKCLFTIEKLEIEWKLKDILEPKFWNLEGDKKN